MAPIFGYWDVRGLGNPIRLMMEYAGADYEDKLYAVGDDPPYDKSSWLDVKYKLGLDFPNLPYYIDGDVKITESAAVTRYIARKYNLCGTTDEEMYRADMFDSVVFDLKWAFYKLCYGFGIENYDFEKEKGPYLEQLPEKLKPLEDFLGDRKWFAGENITFADFIAYEYFDNIQTLSPNCLNAFPKLKQFHNNFEELEKIKAYMNSPKYIKKRITNRMAHFGSGKE